MSRVFNGTTSRVTVDKLVTLGSKISVSARVHMLGEGEGGDFWNVAIQGGQILTGASRNRRWGFWIRMAGERLLYLSVGALTTAGDWAKAITLPLNETHHVGFSYDGTVASNDPIFYIDGVAAGGAFIVDANPVGALAPDPQPLYIGGNELNDGTANGYIQGLAIWRRVLSAAEWAIVHAEGVYAVPTAGLEMYYPFSNADDGSAESDTVALDGSGNDHPATATAAPRAANLVEPRVMVPSMAAPLTVNAMAHQPQFNKVWLFKIGDDLYVADRDFEGALEV